METREKVYDVKVGLVAYIKSPERTENADCFDRPLLGRL